MLKETTSTILTYYAQAGIMTDPGEQVSLFMGLPVDLGELCRVVQNTLVHIFWAERYGLNLSEEQKATVNVRPVSQKLALILQEGDLPLATGRPLKRRQVGNCRDFSTLLASMLRYQGVPARARCGFGAYFLPGHYEDHWVCEVWKASEGRWVLVDAQLDDLQRRALGIGFDPLDVPRDQFILAGQAWENCRSGQADPCCFGIFDMHGIWFIWGNVMRDFLSLNKVEILPWDWWQSAYWSHSLDAPLREDEDLSSYDQLAALTLAGDRAFEELRAAYERDLDLHIPQSWFP